MGDHHDRDASRGTEFDLGVADDHAPEPSGGPPAAPDGVTEPAPDDRVDDGPVGGGPSGDEESEGIGGVDAPGDAGPGFEDEG